MRSWEGPSKRNSLVSTHRQAELPGQGWGGRACLCRLLGFPSASPVPLPITSAGSHALAQGLRCHCSTVIRAQASASLAPLLDQEKEREEDCGEGQLQGGSRKESNAADECSLRGGNHSLGRDGDIPKVRWKGGRLVTIIVTMVIVVTTIHPWVGKIPWRGIRLTTPVFWPGELHGLYSLSMGSQRVGHD